MSGLVRLMVPRRDEAEYAPAVRRAAWAVVVVLALAASAPVMAVVILAGGGQCPVPATT